MHMLHIPRIHRRARSDAEARPARGRRGFQIGPRIRVGGSLGKIGQNVKRAVTKGVTDVGHTVGKVASNPWTQAALAAGLGLTGVGAPAAAALMAGVRGGGNLLKPGGNIGDGLKGAATGAAMGAGVSKLGGLLGKAGGISGVFRGGGADGTGNFGLAGDLAGKLLPGAGGAHAENGFGFGGGGGASDILKLLGLAGAGVAGVQGYKAAKAAGAKQEAALAANSGIAQQLGQQGTALLAGAAPIRQAAEGAMQTRLAAGPRAPTALPRFRSPFKFGPSVPPPPMRL